MPNVVTERLLVNQVEIDTYPEKIYVEITTRCNLHCRMCVKYAGGSTIVDEDLPLAVFNNLAPALTRAKTLILNGIGEPLLHPDLAEIIRLARSCMPPGATIGFQSNGLLLDERRSLDLIAAGLNTVCLSLDSLEENPFRNGEHLVAAVSRAVKHLAAARQRLAADLRIGLEMVLTRENIRKLPQFVRWAGDNGADFFIATHLLHYDRATEGSGLFNPNPPEAMQLFNSYKEQAAALGTDLTNCLATYLKFKKTEADLKVLQLFHNLLQEARDRDIQLHLQSLLDHANTDPRVKEEAFADGRAMAEHYGIELFLPENEALSDGPARFSPTRRSSLPQSARSCPAISSGILMPAGCSARTSRCRNALSAISGKRRWSRSGTTPSTGSFATRPGGTIMPGAGHAPWDRAPPWSRTKGFLPTTVTAARCRAVTANGVSGRFAVYRRNASRARRSSRHANDYMEDEMLLSGYTLEIFRSKCHAGAQTLHCFAHLNDDVGPVLPYLNTVLGGFGYIKEPPALTLKSSGKLITIHPRKIAVNALQDEEQAEKIVAWLQREINSAWENRANIEPSTEGVKQPTMMDVLKLLPKTNCRECGEPTCMVFAVRVIEGAKDHTNCPSLEAEKRVALANYLSRFHFD